MRKRTVGIISLAGAVQGSTGAKLGINMLKKVAPINLEENDQRKNWQEFKKQLAPILTKLNHDYAWFFKNPLVKNIFQSFKVDLDLLTKDYDDEASTMLINSTIEDLYAGLVDLTPYERIRWNLENFKNKYFHDQLTFFNLTALTEIKDFLLPGFHHEKTGETFKAIEFFPQIKWNEAKKSFINWNDFSLDNTFLYFASIDGFSHTPGGLYDTQVGWGDSKSMFLDHRPLSESLEKKELNQLMKENFISEYGITEQDLEKKPRKDLIPLEHRPTMKSIDLGEVRGHHWSIAFKQVLRPPSMVSKNFHQHDFPRKEYFQALLETLTLYYLLQDDSTVQVEKNYEKK